MPRISHPSTAMLTSQLQGPRVKPWPPSQLTSLALKPILKPILGPKPISWSNFWLSIPSWLLLPTFKAPRPTRSFGKAGPRGSWLQAPAPGCAEKIGGAAKWERPSLGFGDPNGWDDPGPKSKLNHKKSRTGFWCRPYFPHLHLPGF